MKLLVYVYNMLAWKPELGIISSLVTYLVAVRTYTLADENLRIVAMISSYAGCLLTCLALLTQLVKGGLWCHRRIIILIVKFKTRHNHETT